MRRLKNLFNPIITLIVVQIVWIGLLVLWILWFLGRHNELRKFAEQYRPELVPTHLNWPVLAGGILMLALVLCGLYVIFIYWKRQSRLYVEQKRFISQITHELKSPLASIRLHLETIRLRNPPPDKMERFLDTMLADTERLNSLISNFLMAAKLEQRPTSPGLAKVDFSAFVDKFATEFRRSIPEGSILTSDIEPGINLKIDSEGMEMVLRNLLENAFLYSNASPEVKLELRSSGRNCILTVSDNGRGLVRSELSKVFRMFYRVRNTGETIRGTGLGLYIVKSVIKRHKGSIVAESSGAGMGTRFVLTLPSMEVR
ncbi:MAG: HAMP domain-containing histidine kinase [Geobacteraceae bacterium]|nr:HAMP domain-containing histidine kinase [Geobacteraceae bacterium]